MSTATSSRRRLTRTRTDEIEQDSSQREVARDGKENRKAAVNGHAANSQGEGYPMNGRSGTRATEQEDENEGRIDVDNLVDQPLTANEYKTLKNLAGDWTMLANKILQCSDTVRDVAVSLAENTEGDEQAEGIETLDHLMRDLIDVSREMGCNCTALNELHDTMDGGEKISNIVERYQSETSRLIEEYKGKTSRQKYAKSNDYFQFREGIYEVTNPGEGIPPLSMLIPKEDDDESDDDDDLEIGGVQQTYQCALSLKPLTDPLTSRSCKHSFDRAAITDMIRQSRGNVRCPAAGCNKMLTMDIMEENKDLARATQRFQKRQRRHAAEESDDAEEIIDYDGYYGGKQRPCPCDTALPETPAPPCCRGKR
ncbi:hypothetical protein FISHEDRAFT_77219 [Fistulina hepatica ATCC 64428]|uniref:SP-RING-type domain-containing protein n=1 Tax=Fistulina hepatica ATCC 64428 TaxID=1128425 RepID=A0A0D7A377_9AGAR|nr:hypothetical protein FISHEDRAFT_77219 [Fistulina hepatica ATCC 64428]